MAQDLSALTPPFARNFALATTATAVTLPANARRIDICGSGTMLLAYAGTDGVALGSGIGYFISTSQCHHADIARGARVLGGETIYLQASTGTPNAYLNVT